jgi:hypothetical protein
VVTEVLRLAGAGPAGGRHAGGHEGSP